MFKKGAIPRGANDDSLNGNKVFPCPGCTELRVGPVPTGKMMTRKSKLDAKAMRSLTFKAFWKRGMEMRPATRATMTNEPRVQKANEMEGWTYTLKIEQSDIPITDHLVIEVLTADGTRVSRLSGQL